MFRLPGEEINRKELTEQIARLMADSKSSANTVSIQKAYVGWGSHSICKFFGKFDPLRQQ